MGREIRMVPKDWQHPTVGALLDADVSLDYNESRDRSALFPMYDERYEDAAREWIANCLAWENGTHEDLVNGNTSKDDYPFYWDWSSRPPTKHYYRFGPWDFDPTTATCVQMYETVTEGTPCSPVFETREQLADWLVSEGRSRASADAFVKDGWAPSMVMVGGRIAMGVDAYDLMGSPASEDADKAELSRAEGEK